MYIYMLHGTVFSHHRSNGHWFVVVFPSFGCDSHKSMAFCITECVSHCVIPPMSNVRQSVIAGTASAHHHTEFMFSICVMQAGV